MSVLQKIIGRLPSAIEDLPFPSSWLAHPPGGAILLQHCDAEDLPPPKSLRLLSWNIHYGYGPLMDHGRGLSRAQVIENLEGIAARIREWSPDLVALQEVDRGALRSHHIDQLEWLAQATGMPFSAWTPTWDAGWVPYPGRDPARHIGQVHSGQAILSRFPLENPRRHALPQPDSRNALTNLFYLHRCLLKVYIRLATERRLCVFNAHLEAFDSKNRQDHAQIASDLIRQAIDPVLLLGDMNCVPPEARVRHAFADEPQTDMRDDQTLTILRQIPGLQEIAGPGLPPEAEENWHSFPAHAPNRRLDYIFFSEAMKLSRAWTQRTDPPLSDHLPVLADLEL